MHLSQRTFGFGALAMGIVLAAVFVLQGVERPEVALAGHTTTISTPTTLTVAGSPYVYHNLVVNSQLILQGTCGSNSGVEIQANDITINTGGSITADGKGCPGGIGASNGQAPTGSNGEGEAGVGGDEGGGGAGYGGAGGSGEGNAGSGGSVYGNTANPTDLGSGGGGVGSSGNGGNGGGAVKFVVKGTLLVQGTLSANGQNGNGDNGVNSSGGGGSGGSILVYTGELNGTGAIQANGGSSGGKKDQGGGGAGGRIALYYFDKGFTGTVSRIGGSSAGGNGGTGSFTEQSYGNTTGWAWSSNVGWISFNCYNDMIPGTPETDHTCASIIYGVDISKTTGNFAGNAWSSTIGWIRFDAPGPYPAAGPSYSACIDLPGVSTEPCNGAGAYAVSGWARACAAAANPGACSGGVNPLSGGWDGWIKMGNAAPPAYGVTFNSTSFEFEGFAWGSDVLGWLSVNCNGGGASGEDICASSNYRVEADIVALPNAINLTTTALMCSSPQDTRLSWTFDQPGETQSAYQVQIDDDPAFGSPNVDSGKVPGASQQYAPLGLSYGTTYYWRVKVWNSVDAASLWVQAPSSFATPAHAYADPSGFSWSPPSPLANQSVQFEDADPFDPAATGQTWNWNFGDATSSSLPDPTHTYTSVQAYTVTLQVCDDVGCCTTVKPLNIAAPLPNWKEISPF